MSRFGLALSAFRRHIGRTIFTVLSVATAFAIFTILGAIEQGMNGNMSLVAAQRLDTFSRVNSSLPQSYAAQVRSVRGVVAVTYLTFFEGYFRDPKNEVPVMAASVPSVLALYPEFLIPDDQKEAFLHDKQGALVGNEIAAQMGWQVGHTVPRSGRTGAAKRQHAVDLPHRRHPSHRSSVGLQTCLYRQLRLFQRWAGGVAHERYGERDRLARRQPKDMDRVAVAIDNKFTNASPDTRTESEQQEAMSAIRQFGDIGTIVTYVGLAVFASMLLITGNTMANSVRERMGEFAMMRALGFSRLQLVFIVLRESALLIGAGAALGVLAGWGVSILMAKVMMRVLESFAVTWVTVALAAAFALLFALVTGLLPGRRVADMPVATTLRRM